MATNAPTSAAGSSAEPHRVTHAMHDPDLGIVLLDRRSSGGAGTLPRPLLAPEAAAYVWRWLQDAEYPGRTTSSSGS